MSRARTRSRSRVRAARHGRRAAAVHDAALRGGPRLGVPRGDITAIARAFRDVVEKDPPSVLFVEQAARALQLAVARARARIEAERATTSGAGKLVAAAMAATLDTTADRAQFEEHGAAEMREELGLEVDHDAPSAGAGGALGHRGAVLAQRTALALSRELARASETAAISLGANGLVNVTHRGLRRHGGAPEDKARATRRRASGSSRCSRSARRADRSARSRSASRRRSTARPRPSATRSARRSATGGACTRSRARCTTRSTTRPTTTTTPTPSPSSRSAAAASRVAAAAAAKELLREKEPPDATLAIAGLEALHTRCARRRR